MRLTNEVILEQQQRLLITPELHQAIAILQMSTLELMEHIQKELVENPFLEEKEEQVEERDYNLAKIREWLDSYGHHNIALTQREQYEESSIDQFLTQRPSLYEHLEFQLRLESKDQEDTIIGTYLIGSIDSNGYINVGLEEVAQKYNVSIERVEEVLGIIQSFHPHGVGARNLSECLLLQLKHYGKDCPVARQIVENYLADLGRGNLNKIAHELSLPVQKIQEICDTIRTLDPRPGRQYSYDAGIKYIMPDVFVEKIEGEYVVIVNEFQFPRLRINNFYETLMRQPESFSPDTRKYLEDKMGSAIWLIKSIEQRRRTLYKVALTIVEIQKEFLDKGIEYLKPLKLREIADLVDVHESTVSRATSNKYIQTPQGLFEMKYFFSGGVNLFCGNECVSSRSIKYIIEEIVSGEDPTRPLSDQAIAKKLMDRGIRISRRTVAKYRQEMGIQSTMARKRYKT
ncbi:MAG: RNA polymerase factor sigma-54 [Syntrophomonadaceae bacterium]